METSILEEISAIIKASDWIIKNIRCTNEYKIAIAELLTTKASLPILSICKDNIPPLTENTLYCATDLLKYYHVNISTAEFNKIMMDINMMKEVNKQRSNFWREHSYKIKYSQYYTPNVLS